MTQQEKLYLEKGRIPARIVLDEIVAYIEKHAEVRVDGSLESGGLIEGIAEKGGISPSSIITWLGQERVQSIEFDVADRIMIYLLGPQAWLGEYAEYYYAVDLSWKKCENPHCEIMFKPHPQSGRKYCSKPCSDSAWNIRHGRTHRTVKPLRKHNPEVCRNGHPRTPENTKTRKDGRTECVLCSRANARRLWRERYSPKAQRAAA